MDYLGDSGGCDRPHNQYYRGECTAKSNFNLTSGMLELDFGLLVQKRLFGARVFTKLLVLFPRGVVGKE